MISPSQAPGDEHLHDFVGASVDALDAGIAVHAGNGKFVHVTITTVQLQATVDDPALEIGHPIFGHGGGDGVERFFKVAGDAVIDEDAADGCLGLALGKFELRVLEVDDRLAEGSALLDEVDRDLKRALDPTGGVQGNEQTLLWELVHEHVEALPFVAAEKASSTDLHVIEEKLGGVIGLEPDLVEIAA